jgi:Yip1 domain
MATPVVTPPEPVQQISDFARIPGALFSPGATFTDIARKPSWIVPVLMLTVLGLGVTFFLNQKMDWPNFVRHQQEKSARWQQLTDEQKDQSVAIGAKFSPAIAWVIGSLGAILGVIIISFFYMVAFNVMSGAQIRYGNSMGIVAYAFMPSIISTILVIVVLSLKRFGDVDPQRMLATSVAAFLPSDAPSWQVSLGGSLELFWIWTMVLMAIGYNKANPKKITSGTAYGMVFGLWAVYVLVKVGLSAAF